MRHIWIQRLRLLPPLLFVLVAGAAFAQAPPQKETGPRVFVVRQLNAVGITGYEYSARGPEDSLDVSVDSSMAPGFYGSSLQLGIGTMVREDFLMAFAPAVWYWPSFQAFAYTPGALLAQYTLGGGSMAPIMMAHAGIYIELPDNYFGLFGEISAGIEIRRDSSTPLQLTIGYLFTRYGFDGTAPGDDTYLNIDEVRRHSVTISASTSLGRGD